MATIKDVAKEAGVAVETVSRVMNNRGYISEKTREKVTTAMNALNYTPNAFARGLSKKQMDFIAVIVPHVAHPFFAKFISNIEKEATKRDYKIFLYNTSGDRENESEVLTLAQNSLMTGALLFSSDFKLKALEKFNIPIVLIEREGTSKTPSIQCDNAMGGAMAAKHLISKGCKHLIVISTYNPENMPGDDREEAFIKECHNAGVSCSVYRATPKQYEEMMYYETIETAVRENPDCDGIFATADLIGAQVIQVCSREGLKIPEDIKLVGFDDVELSRLTTPSMTTIRQPIREMAELAVDMIDRLKDGKTVAHNNIMKVSLVERETTA
ncbi:MAG: LacI family transcriptional regulator [Lachnospiraceae bacterium]|nr:LacI family transcriptional regulator [Lachnospiraceae bacterium]